jgi:hypothetical protein
MDYFRAFCVRPWAAHTSYVVLMARVPAPSTERLRLLQQIKEPDSN